MAEPYYPSSDLDAQSADITRRRTLASLLQKQGMEGVAPPAKGLMHWSQTLGPALSAALGGYQQNQLDAQSKDLASQRNAATKDWLASMPQGTPGQAAEPGVEPYAGASVGPLARVEPKPAMLPKAPDPTKMMQWAGQGAQFGGQAAKIADIAGASAMKNITDPYDKVGNDLFNRVTGEYSRSPQSLEESQSKIQDRLDRNSVALQALADKKDKSDADRAQAMQIHTENMQMKRDIAQMMHANSGGKQQLAGGTDAAGQPLMVDHQGNVSVVTDNGLKNYTGHIYKPNDEKVLQAGATAAQGVADMKGILKASQDDPKIFGGRAAMAAHVPTSMGMQAAASGLTPEQLAVRSQAASMTANTTHSMYGTAFSANEAKQAAGFLLKPDDTNVEVQRKMQGRINLELGHYKNLPAWQRDAIAVRSPDLAAAIGGGGGGAAPAMSVEDALAKHGGQ